MSPHPVPAAVHTPQRLLGPQAQLSSLPTPSVPKIPFPATRSSSPPSRRFGLLTLLGVWGHLFHESNKVFQELGVVIRQVEVFAIFSGVWGTRFVVCEDGKGKVSFPLGTVGQVPALLPAPGLVGGHDGGDMPSLLPVSPRWDNWLWVSLRTGRHPARCPCSADSLATASATGSITATGTEVPSPLPWPGWTDPSLSRAVQP